jgi:uncharacterized UPF0160 family protein
LTEDDQEFVDCLHALAELVGRSIRTVVANDMKNESLEKLITAGAEKGKIIWVLKS